MYKRRLPEQQHGFQADRSPTTRQNFQMDPQVQDPWLQDCNGAVSTTQLFVMQDWIISDCPIELF